MSEPTGVDEKFNRALPMVFESAELRMKHFQPQQALPAMLVLEPKGADPESSAYLVPKEAREVGLAMLCWASEQGETLVWATLPPHLHDDAKKAGLLQIFKKEGVYTLEEIERQAILNALSMTEGRQTEAAKLLGCSKRKIQYRMKQYRKEGLIK